MNDYHDDTREELETVPFFVYEYGEVWYIIGNQGVSMVQERKNRIGGVADGMRRLFLFEDIRGVHRYAPKCTKTEDGQLTMSASLLKPSMPEDIQQRAWGMVGSAMRSAIKQVVHE